MRRVCICLVLLLLCVPAAYADNDSAPDTQIADWVFRLPDTMKIVTGLDGKPALAFKRTPDNMTTSARFTFSADLQGDDLDKAYQDWAKDGRDALKKSLDIEGDGEVTRTTTAAGYDMLAWAAAYSDQRHVDWVAILTCLRHDRRAGGFLFFTNDFTRLKENAADMDTLLNTATFASCRGKDDPPLKLKVHIDPTSTPSFLWDPPPELPKGEAGLEGIYGATKLSAAGDPREGIGTVDFRWSYYTFFADGRVMRMIPPEGLLSFRFEYWQQHYGSDCGRYVMKEDRVEMTFDLGDGKTDSVTLKRKGADLLDGDKPFAKLAGTAKLKGKFRRINAEQYSEQRRQEITFHEDGSFEDEGFNSTINIGWWVGGDYSLRDMDPVPGKGKWRAEKNTLELIYEDGRRRRFAFHRYTDQPEDNPKLIVLNGNLLSRE